MVYAFPCEPCLVEWRQLAQASPIFWRDEAAWRGVFARADLSIQRAELWIEKWHFPSALHLARTLHESGVTGRAQLGPARLRQAIRAYDTRHTGPPGVVSTWAWLAVESAMV
jgi:hypothetical protein